VGNTKITARIVLGNNFPYMDFQLKGISPEDVMKVVSVLEKEFIVHKSYKVFRDAKIVAEALVFSKEEELLAAINVNYGDFLPDKFIGVSVAYAPNEKGYRVLRIFENSFEGRMVPYSHVTLNFFGRWGNVSRHIADPCEFTKSIIPEFFYGVDILKLSESFLKSSQNILILFGKPGTGKSKLIQYILGQSPLVYGKSVNVLVMKGEENIRNGANSINIYFENDIVIFDDFDFLYLKRGDDEEISDVVSTILSATDGFVPKRVKVIISTNRTFKEIDSALLRPSRLFDILELKDIPREHYLNLCEKYPELLDGVELFKERKSVSVAEIFDFLNRKKFHLDYLKKKEISRRCNPCSRKLGFKCTC